MAKFVSGYSALLRWGVPFLMNIRGLETIDTGMTEYTVTSRGERNPKEGEIIHLCSTHLPEGSVVMKDGIKIASPELAFLQLAGRLEIKSLILLGLLLCSHPPGQPEKAITTKENLTRIIEAAYWHRGRRKARRAVKYVKNGCNSDSIMEALAYMAIALPPILGGFSFKDVVFNKEITLDEKSSKHLNQKRCFGDLCFEKSKVIVEYDSSAHHSTTAEQRRDARRTAALKRLGYKIISLTTIELYDEFKFDIFMMKLASSLRKNFRKNKSEKYSKIRESLRSLFPTRPKQEVYE